MSTADAIIKQIESLGYAVSVHRVPSSLLGTVGAFVELHAVKVPENEPVWMSRNASNGIGRGSRVGTPTELEAVGDAHPYLFSPRGKFVAERAAKSEAGCGFRKRRVA